MLEDEEMIRILEEVARSSKSAGARIEAIKQLQRLKEARGEVLAPAVKQSQENDAFEGLYDVKNPGRVRRAS